MKCTNFWCLWFSGKSGEREVKSKFERRKSELSRTKADDVC